MITAKPAVSYKRMKQLLAGALRPWRGRAKLSLGGECDTCKITMRDDDITYRELAGTFCLTCAPKEELFCKIEHKIPSLEYALRWKLYYEQVDVTKYIVKELNAAITKSERVEL